MKVAFIYPRRDPTDGIANWIAMLSRYNHLHMVEQATCAEEAHWADCVLAITHGEVYPRERIDRDLALLAEMKIPAGVVHNEDGGVPAPGRYPSFAWTRRAQCNLVGYSAILLRMPVVPRTVFTPRGDAVHLGTFGHCEPKKSTLQIAEWARDMHLPLTVFAPSVLSGLYAEYIAQVRGAGATVHIYPWHPRAEMLDALMAGISHFVFVLHGGKAGSGGSPSSPRAAATFGRPVIVIDDEDIFRADGYNVFGSLSDVHWTMLAGMNVPRYDWTPEAYVDALCYHTLTFHGRPAPWPLTAK